MNKRKLGAALRARPRQQIVLPGYAESAVLALLHAPDDVAELEAAELLFTVRHADLRTHAGQISFPGGRREPGDANLITTALRETQEELGAATDDIEVLGMLDDVPTPSEFMITPVVGLIQGPLLLRPDDAEVAMVFRCPIGELLAPQRYRDGGRRTWQGVEYVMHEYRWAEHRIWGATARIVQQLLELFAHPAPP